MSPKSLLLRALLFATVVLATASPARAADPSSPAASDPSEADKQRASDHFRRGVDLYRDGDYRAALVEFERAYDIAPNYRVLFNLGQASFELKDYPSALQAFEGYLTQGGDEIDAERRAVVEGELAKLKNYVARLELTVNVADAEVAVDDIVVGHTPLAEPLVVGVGRRKLTISKPGHTPLQRYVDVAGGETKPLELALAPIAGPAAAPPPPAQPATPPDKPAGESDYTGFWISLAVTGVLASGATAMGILALGANSDYEAELDTYPTSADAISSARDDVKLFATLTDVFAALAIGSAGVTIALAITSASSDDDAEEATSQLNLIAGPGAVHLVGSF